MSTPVQPAKVQAMFDNIAPTYDRVNSVLSFGIHHGWRKTLVKLAGFKTGESLLDCATGTGDLAIELKQVVGPAGSVVGIDFSAEMLRYAPAKAEAAGAAVRFEQADILALPFESARFDGATIAFGIRNVGDVTGALKQMARVVRPGGTVAILEFGQPDGILFGPFYRFYSNYVMPLVGGLISGDRDAYRYLPETAAAFPAGDDFDALMRATGSFAKTSVHKLFGGIAYVYLGKVAG